jgi:hypothetical protein
MKLTCPACQTTVPAAQINVERALAACANCGEVFALALPVRTDEQPPELRLTQNGAWFEIQYPLSLMSSTRRSIIIISAAIVLYSQAMQADFMFNSGFSLLSSVLLTGLMLFNILYYISHMRILLSTKTLMRQYWPFSWRVQRLSTNEIASIEAVKVSHPSRHNLSVYRVEAVLHTGKREALTQTLPEAYAVVIADALRQRLHH